LFPSEEEKIGSDNPREPTKKEDQSKLENAKEE